MAMDIPAPTTLDPLGYALGRGLAQGMRNFGGALAARWDQRALNDWFGRNQANRQLVQISNDFLGGGQPGMMDPTVGLGGFRANPPSSHLQQMPPTPLPFMPSPAGQALTHRLMQARMNNMLPTSEIDRARIESYRAGAERDRAYAENLRTPTVEQDPYSVPYLVRSLGFTPKEAIEARNIHYGLSPRASSAKPDTVLDRLNTLSTLYQKTLDPAWGERMPELQGLGDIVLGEIDTLTDVLKQAGVPASVIEKAKETGPVSPPKAVAPKNRAQIGRELAKLHKTERFPVPVPKIVSQYPRLAEKMLDLTPAERAEVVESIKKGMSEDDILQYVR